MWRISRRRECEKCKSIKSFFVASSYRSAYNNPMPNIPNFVSLMIHVSYYFLSHYFGILYKVESCITT